MKDERLGDRGMDAGETPEADAIKTVGGATDAGAAREKLGQATGRTLRRLLDRDLGDELEQAMAQFDPSQLLADKPGAASSARKPGSPPTTDKRTVRVLAVRGGDVYVNLGEKSEGILDALQFGDTPPAAGDLVEVIVDRYDAANDVYVLRRPGAAQEADWGSIRRGMLVDARVDKVNKGGLEVRVSGIRGFLPAGQVALEHIADLSIFVGQSLLCEVAEANLSDRNLVVNRRAVLERERAEKARQTLASLEEGQVRDGVVRRITDFGAFVDIGGVDGLVPIREMSWTRVRHPGDLLATGQEIKVVVLRHDRETGKISLGLKQLTESPWQRAAMKFRPGSFVSGNVTKIMDFGAFVELEPGVEGLIHISELSRQRVRRVEDIVKPGQGVEVKVLDFDSERQRIGLSLKQATPEPEPIEDEPEASDAPSAPKTPPERLRGGLGNRSGPLFG